MPTLELKAEPLPGGAKQQQKGPGRTYRVEFPFAPYEAQRAYMGKVLQALDGRTNALLESPTGTGKTLSLLCSTLAWQQRQGSVDAGCGGAGGGGGGAGVQLKYEEGPSALSSAAAGGGGGGGLLFPRVQGGGGSGGAVGEALGLGGKPVVVYASRTHAQLTQVVKELKSTAYRPRSVLLGSREQLCVHPEVSKLKGGMQNRRCGLLTANRSCRFKNNLESYTVDSVGAAPEVQDIEELVELGKGKQICPYYLMRQQTPQADLVLMPYNYLLDAGSRKPYQVRWPGSVIVFDEAHNLEGVASDAWSVELSTATTAGVLGELEQAYTRWRANDSLIPVASSKYNKPPVQEDFTGLKLAIKALEDEIDAIQLTAPSSNDWGGGNKAAKGKDAGPPLLSATLSAPRFLDMLERSGLGASRYEEIVGRLERVSDFILDGAAAEGADAPVAITSPSGSTKSFNAYKIEQFLKAYRMIYFWGRTDLLAKNMGAYRLHVTKDMTAATNDQLKHKRVLHYWCFSPGLAMEQLVELQVRSILLTSGTLSPLDSFAAELRIPFPVRLENEHVITVRQQAWLGVLGTGPNDRALSSAFGRRNDQDYLAELGETLIRLARLVPAGLLVFFPSYGVMESCLKRWKQRGVGVYDRLNQVKPILEEPKRAADLPACMLAYDSFLRDRGGACLLAVCRGKVSEGMDFADHRARAVVITGIPFAPAKDPKVELKKKYLDEIAAQAKGGAVRLKGMEWYVQQAARAVNQAVGRVIRHRDDYGAVILLDERFGKPQQLQALSAWARPHTQVFTASSSNEEEQGGGGYAAAAESLRAFFQSVRGIPRLNPSGRPRLGAGARAPADAYSDEEADDDDEEEEEIGRRRGAVVVDPSKLAGDDGYLAPSAITRELPPLSQQPGTQWRPGGEGGGGVGDGSVQAGREAALHKFLEFKAAIKQQQTQERGGGRTAAPSSTGAAAPPSTSLASLFAQKQQASASATAATAAAARRPLVRKGSLSAALGLSGAAAGAAPAAAAAAAAAIAPSVSLSQPPPPASSSLLSRCLSQGGGGGSKQISSTSSRSSNPLLGRKRTRPVGLSGAISISSSSSSIPQTRPPPLAVGGGKKGKRPPSSTQPSASCEKGGKEKENRGEVVDGGEDEMEEDEWREDQPAAAVAAASVAVAEEEEEEDRVDIEEMDAWCKEAKAALGPERFAQFQQHLKAALKGQVQTMKEFQAWAHPALSAFLSTPGADPPFLHRLATTALPPFLVPIFDGMVKTRYRPKPTHPIAKAAAAPPAPSAPTPAASFASVPVVAVKQEKGAGEVKPFIVPGSEEEALGAGAGGTGKRLRPEGSSGLSATGLSASQELLSHTTRRDRDVLARLQRVMQQQQRETAAGKKKRVVRDGGGGGEGEEAVAKQQCRLCYQTAAVYVSPCGHLGCLTCWKGWLGRFPEGTAKCFYKCGPVTLRQLKRVVHDHPQAAAAAASKDTTKAAAAGGKKKPGEE